MNPSPDEIRAAMRERGLTGSALARLVRVNPRTVRRWTGGDISIPYAAWRLLQEQPTVLGDDLPPVEFFIRRCAVVRGPQFSAEFEQDSDGAWWPSVVAQRRALDAVIDAAPDEDSEAAAAALALNRGVWGEIPAPIMKRAGALLDALREAIE